MPLVRRIVLVPPSREEHVRPEGPRFETKAEHGETSGNHGWYVVGMTGVSEVVLCNEYVRMPVSICTSAITTRIAST